MAKKYIPILGRGKHATSMRYQVDNIMTRLYLVQENQFQIVDNKYVPSLKRAFKNCSSFRPEELEDLAKKEIEMGLSYTFKSYEIFTKVEKIKDMDYRLSISGVVMSDDGAEKHQLNLLLSYDGSNFVRMVKDLYHD